MKCLILAAIVSSIFCLSIVDAYTVKARVINNHIPVLNSQKGQSSFVYNYNAAWVPQKDGEGGLIVRCQNLKNPNDPYDTTPSVLAWTKLDRHSNDHNFTFSTITPDSVVFAPESDSDAFGTEDPRIVFRQADQTYYLLYSAVQSYPNNNTVISRLALATSKKPTDRKSWKRHGPVFPDMGWSKSGAMLIRDGKPGPHYLFFGDSTLVPGLQIATSTDLLTWTLQPGFLITVRNDSFDSTLVEAGPLPLTLSDGNYLFIYNSARCCFPSKKPGYQFEYNVGWVILDKDDPTQVLARSDVPLLSPELAWEKGSSPYLGLTPNVVFLEGWRKKPGHINTFIGFYGAADSVIGIAEITVSMD
jgi:predicted GH43/DUF377 family glycosyl hydrolase